MTPSKIIQKVDQYIAEKKLLHSKKTYLLAISGGLDSMTLCHYFLDKKLSFAIAHCNFNLRGSESQQDEALVRDFAEKHQIKFHRITFQTAEFAEAEGISIQMAARQLRYQWLEAERKKYFYEATVTAHHSNDNLETILLNFSKGTGISGLRGMHAKSKELIRPFLCINRAEIAALGKAWNVAYREDSSNASDKYQRNFIRHQVVPLLEQINPHLSQSITQHSEYVAAAEYIYKAFIQKKLHRIIQLEQGISKAPIRAFQHQVYGKNLLFEWLNNVGFTSNQIPDIVHAIHTKQSGKIFLSTTHQLSCDRTFMYLIQKEENAFIPLSVEDFTEQELTIQHKKITFSIQQTAAKSFDDTNQTVYLDADKIAVPLLIRTWNQGDYMYPLGMKMKKKKLSDLFSNQKVPNHQKQALLVFESHQKIIFVEGIRIDERFKITDQTTRFLKISVQNIGE